MYQFNIYACDTGRYLITVWDENADKAETQYYRMFGHSITVYAS